MEKTYFLSILRRFRSPVTQREILKLTMLSVKVAQSIQWVCAHADEIAARAHGADYCALWVSEMNPAPEWERQQ